MTNQQVTNQQETNQHETSQQQSPSVKDHLQLDCLGKTLQVAKHLQDHSFLQSIPGLRLSSYFPCFKCLDDTKESLVGKVLEFEFQLWEIRSVDRQGEVGEEVLNFQVSRS